MTVPSYLAISRIITPLRLIFWGGLLCLFDLSVASLVDGEGWRFDFLNDAVGMIMILVGLSHLRQFIVHERYSATLRFVTVVAVFALLKAIHDHRVYEIPPFLSFLFQLLGIAKVVAIVVFCVAMRWLCQVIPLEQSAMSWTTTIILFTIIYLTPLGIFYFASAVAMITGSSFYYHTDSGWGIPLLLLMLFIFFIPLLHLFVSTSIMACEAESLAETIQDAPEE